MCIISRPKFQTETTCVIYYVYLPVWSSPIQSSKPNLCLCSAILPACCLLCSASASYKQFRSEQKNVKVRKPRPGAVRTDSVINIEMSSQARARNPEQAEEGQVATSSDNLITQEHSLQLVENLRKFYEDEYCFLYDVILVSRGGGQVRAHKVILAAQSDYFKVKWFVLPSLSSTIISLVYVPF